MKANYNIILSGGGTGGHIYPAIAIADEFKVRYPDSNILFVGAKGRMEMEKVPQAGYQIIGLWISGIQRRLTLENLSFPLKLAQSILRARKIIKNFKPDIVVGTGGYASGPLLYAASKRHIPSLIQEQNSFPGITNRYLGKTVDKVCVAYDDLEQFFPVSKLIKTGNPVRKQMLEYTEDQIHSKTIFKLKHSRYTLLVIGGSLGARRINQFIESRLEFFNKMNVELIWQCGNLYYKDYMIYDELPYVNVYPFIRDIYKAYVAADIIISRAGALSVSELCIVGKPVIFIPSPNVVANHQIKNAEAIAKKQAAIVIREPELESKFDTEFKALISSDEKRKQLSEAIQKIAIPDATQRIVNELEILLKAKNN